MVEWGIRSQPDIPHMSDLQSSVVDGLFLFNQSEQHRIYTLDEFNAFFIYPLLAGKCRIFYEDGRPVALATWAWLSDDEAEDFLNMDWMPVEETYARDVGDQLWGIEFIAPYGHARPLMRAMRNLNKELYGDTVCHWRRLQDPHTEHRRSF